jgi:hypothetical protein
MRPAFRLRDFLAELHNFKWTYSKVIQYGIRTKEEECRCPIEAVSDSKSGQAWDTLERECQSIGIPYYDALMSAADNSISAVHSYANVQELRSWLLFHCGLSKIRPNHNSALPQKVR